MRLRSAGWRMGTFSSPHSLAPMLGKGFDILPALKDGDSFCKTAMSRRENVLGSINVAVVCRSAIAASPLSKHVDSPF